ncbi:MAG: NAD(P)-dependent oxidoreductase [bacterium]|nr:NAD(P)-dependent oxidoreductase [bacterium]
MKKNILIVGGAGYVGGAVTDLLCNSDHTIRVYDALFYEDAYRKPIPFIHGDIRDYEKLAPHLRWADVVIWLAAIVGDGAGALSPDVTEEVNVASVQWLSDHFDGRIIFPSTSMVYGAQPGALDESAAIQPLSLYAKTKYAAEAILAKRHALIFRFATLFGIGDTYTRPRFDLVVHLFTRQAFFDHRMTVFGGEQARAVLHVRDAAAMVVAGVTSKEEGVFNLHHENVTVKDIALRIEHMIPGSNAVVTPRPDAATGDYALGSEKARTLLHFAPRYRLEDGIAEVKALFTEGRLQNVLDLRYSNEEFLKTHPLHLWKK